MRKTNQIEREEHLQTIAKCAKRCAESGMIFYGDSHPDELRPFTHDVMIDGRGVRVMFTRDAGMHTGGWLKNPDYDKCYHLSVSYRDPFNGRPIPQEKGISNDLCQHIFGENVRLLWVEGPKSDTGRQFDVWHYRLMCDKHWQPIKPRKEVYSKDFTEKGWKSFSDIHGHKPLMTQEA